LKRPDETLRPVLTRLTVVVREADEAASSGTHSGVSRGGRPGVRLTKQAHPRRLRNGVGDRVLVGRPIVNDDHLELILDGLLGKCFQAPP
jgi:hypothetical protein